MSNKALLLIVCILLLILGLLGGLLFLLSNDETDTTQTTTKTTTLTSQNNSGHKDSYPIVDTGQDVCSNNSSEISCTNNAVAFYGQDAAYFGNQPSYTDNRDGTVTDNVTGLMWQQDPGDKQNYYDAIAGVDDFELAGYTDWRVPTIKELYSLIDFRGTDVMSDDTTGVTPFIDTDYFEFEYGDTSAGERAIDSQWVTSTIYKSKVMNNQECFFGVNFADGRIKCYPTQAGKGYFAIYVRGNAYGENTFTDNGDKTISDNATGLMWMKEDNGEGVNWEEALAYCEQLEFAGNEDWRLPNAKELQGLVDYDRSPDTTNSPAIDPLFNATKITNEVNEDDYGFYWTGTTHIRYPASYDSGVYISFGRAMGYMNEQWLDVHGAGAQRSDPKDGDPSEFELGQGPQGDARRIFNYVRCVRDI